MRSRIVTTGFRQVRTRGVARVMLEGLEARTLLSAAVASAAGNQALAYVPNEIALNSPKYTNLWHLNNTGQTISPAITGSATGTAGADISAQDAWDLTTGSNNVVIAVFDTGVDFTHPDLVDNLWTNPGEVANNGVDDDGNGFVDDYYGWNFVNGNNNVNDTVGHGTTVAGVIGARGNNEEGITGVAWNVDLLTVKVGTASGVTSQDLVNGINYVIALKQAGVNVVAINASYISSGTLGLTEIAAIGNAGGYDILYVAAAGNGGINYDTFGFGAFLPSNMLLVGATDNKDRLASYSNYGSNAVVIAAPGTDVQTTFLSGTYATVSGTSYAAPMVAGVVALLKSEAPTATMAQVKNALLTGADTVAALSGKIGGSRRLNAAQSLQVLIGAQAPIGAVEVVNSSVISGYAFDFNAGRNAISVRVVIDGVTYTPVVANVERPELEATLGSTGHGFVIATPTLGSGTHAVSVYALDNPNGTATLLGTGSFTTVAAPVGYVDGASRVGVSGWALDQDTPTQAINVRLYIDGVLYMTVATSSLRGDVNAAYSVSGNHGFYIALPELSVGIHRVDVYALDSTTSALTLVGTRTIDTNRAPTGWFDGVSGGHLVGWVYDLDTPAEGLRVRVEIDGLVPVYIQANLYRPDVNAYTGGSHAYSYAMPQMAAGAHFVTAYVVDSTSGVMHLLGTSNWTVTSPAGNLLPIGYLDTATTSVAAGWVYDPSTSTPIHVRVDIDGVTSATFLANQSRADLQRYLSSANHAFSYTLPTLSAGAHRIDVYAIDSVSGAAVIIGRRLVGLAPSAGYVDGLNANSAYGWAYNPTVGTGPAKVRVDIDDFAGTAVAASASRGDLTAVVGSPNHGFMVGMPKVAAGEHRVRVWILDDYLFATLLSDQVLTFA